MTATRDPDRLLRAWLDLMPDEAPDRAIAAVLQATRGASQVRALPWDGIRRTPRMNRLTLIAATALVAIALTGGAILLTGGSNGPPVVPTQTAATPTAATPTASPEPSQELAGPPAELIWGDWIADVEAIPGIQQPAGRIQMSIDWQDGLNVWIQQDVFDSRLVVESMSYPAAANELRVQAKPSVGCASGQEGRYRWTRSPDGLFLTLELIEDACANRATAFARTWVRSHGAVNDGGTGVLYGMDPDMQFTMPTGQRYGLGGGDHAADLKTFGDAQPFRALVVIRNPGGFDDPCSTTDTRKSDIAHTTDAFVAYVQSLPGATATTSDASIGGRPAVKLDVSMDTAVECASGAIEAFHPELLTDTNSWAFAPGEVQTIYIVEMDATTTFLLWYQGPAAEAQAVLDSIQFIDALPTP